MDDFTIFTESNEDMGLLYNSYKEIGKYVDGFLKVIEEKISQLLRDPDHTFADLREEINKFKSAVDKKPTPSAINMDKVGSIKASVKNYRSEMEKLLDRYAKARNKMSFGGNLMRSIIMKSKVYSKNIDPESYDRNNKNIRNIDRALDWIEKVLIDLFNLIDQDLNILTIVGKVYGKKKIYEQTEIFQSGDFDKYKVGDDDLLATTIGDFDEATIGAYKNGVIEIPVSNTKYKARVEQLIRRYQAPIDSGDIVLVIQGREDFINNMMKDCGCTRKQAEYDFDNDKIHGYIMSNVPLRVNITERKYAVGGFNKTYEMLVLHECTHSVVNSIPQAHVLTSNFQEGIAIYESGMLKHMLEQFRKRPTIGGRKYYPPLLRSTLQVRNIIEEKGYNYLIKIIKGSISEPAYDDFINKTPTGYSEAGTTRLDKSNKIDTVADLVKNCKTPYELFDWMRCIQYAFIDKNGNTIDSDSTNRLYEEYRYQSPAQVIRRKKGVCWDCTGLARQWFERSKYPFCEIYLEIVDDEDCPSHTIIIFKDPGEFKQVYWFESSWDAKKGIHPYEDLRTCMNSVVNKFLKSHDADPKTTKLICTSINKGMKCGCTMQEYMDFAHNSFEIDLDDLSYDEIFNESYISEGVIPHQDYTFETLPNELYFSSPFKVKELKGQVFMCPYAGISSIFIVDRFNIFKDCAAKELGHPVKKNSVNIGYREWSYEVEDLQQPLKTVHMNHNVPQVTGTYTGSSSGYIYKVDISEVRDKLHRHGNHALDREVIYRGDKPLKILEVKPHTIKWELIFSEDNAKHAGEGYVESGELFDSNSPHWSSHIFMEAEEPTEKAPVEEEPKEEVKESMPKKTDKIESSKNGVRRKKLYVAFIEWAKEYNSKNTFGSIFDKDIFHNVYPFVPDEMRYFYRLANPILCVLSGDLTFFQVSELKKLNAENKEMDKLLIFAATPNDLRVFNREDKRVYVATESNGKIELGESVGDTFDLYIQKMINRGDILNGSTELESE